jgi:hypothetical protein
LSDADDNMIGIGRGGGAVETETHSIGYHTCEDRCYSNVCSYFLCGESSTYLPFSSHPVFPLALSEMSVFLLVSFPQSGQAISVFHHAIHAIDTNPRMSHTPFMLPTLHLHPTCKATSIINSTAIDPVLPLIYSHRAEGVTVNWKKRYFRLSLEVEERIRVEFRYGIADEIAL